MQYALAQTGCQPDPTAPVPGRPAVRVRSCELDCLTNSHALYKTACASADAAAGALQPRI